MAGAGRCRGKSTTSLIVTNIYAPMLCLIVMSGFVSSVPMMNLTIFDESGTAITSPGGAVRIGSRMKVRCAYPEVSSLARLWTPNAYIAVVYVHKIGNSAIQDAQTQVNCNLLKSPLAIIVASDIHSTVVRNETVCTPSYLDVTMIPALTTDPVYYCEVLANGFTVFQHSTSQTVHTYSEPTVPVLTSTDNKLAYEEGEQMHFKCFSTAKPAPKLQITSNDFNPLPAEWQHDPSLGSIKKQDPSRKSEVTWSRTAKRQMDGGQLKCVITDHPSNSQAQGEITLIVYYGPDDEDPSVVTWFLLEVDELNITCEFDASGLIQYSWTDSSGSRISADQTLTLRKADYTQFIEKREPIYFWCYGANTQLNYTEGSHLYIVNISDEIPLITAVNENFTVATDEIPLTKAVNENSTVATDRTAQKATFFSGFSAPMIAVIAAGICIFIGVVFFITIMCRKRSNRNNHASLRKASTSELPAWKSSNIGKMTDYSGAGADNEPASPHVPTKPSLQRSPDRLSHRSSIKSGRSSRGSSIRGKRRTSKRDHADVNSEEL